MGIFRRRDEDDFSDLSVAGTVWCHACGGEFLGGTSSVCFDCGGPLSHAPPPDAGASGDADVDADHGGAAGGGEVEPEVEYDLGDWTSMSRSMLTTQLDRIGIAHVWQDAVLVVLEADEGRTDALVEEVQVSSEDALDALVPLPLRPGGDVDVHDLSDWSEGRRREVHRRLCFATVAFELDGDGQLMVHPSDAELVAHVLDAVEFPDALPEAAEQPEDRPDLPPAMEVLSDLYVAADRIKGNARDAKAITSAVASVEDLVELTMPYGYDPPQWERLVAEADELWELLVDGGTQDDIEASAKRLRDLLHPLV